MDEDLTGRIIGSYHVEARIGAGGMGEVYRAHDAKLDRPVALKLLSSAVAADADRLRRFHAEARAASSLNHPNILVIHDFGEVDGRPFIVSELVDGQTLRQRMEQGPLPVREAVDLAAQVASALGAAHARGIVHRDIKPENIMIRPDGYVKVLDFGLAKLTSPDSAAQDAETEVRTTPGMVMGTPRYMSPEQVRGLDTNPGTDVWSAGVVLYEMVTGRAPFSGHTAADLTTAILSAEPEPVGGSTSRTPDALSPILTTALAKEPAHRYTTATELHRELVALRTGIDSGLYQSAGDRTPASERQHTVGRDKERAALRDAFRRAASGQGHVLSISGEPGSGKTTLVEGFLDGLRTSQPPPAIARGRCSERLAGAEAYLPVLEALEALLQAGGPDILQLMSSVAPTWHSQVATSTPASGTSARAADAPAGSQERLKRELAALLRDVSRLRPLVLFFDDVHWADASTIDLLAYLAPRFADLRVLLVVTSRPSDLLLTGHPFLSLRQDLQGRRLCHEISLDMLTRADVERYLALEFPGHRFPPELPALVHAKTEGSPLFMADLARYLRANETVVQDADGCWVLEGSLSAIGRDLPESVRGMIDRKIAQLSDEDRALLTAASVQGHGFDSAIVAQALGQDPARVEERLELLERAHRFVRLIDEREFPDRTLTLRYQFVHVLYQNALYGQLRATRKVTLSAAVAEALLRCYGARHREVASELAALFEAGRDFSRAAEYYGLAAQHAASLFASQEAVVLATRAVALLQSLPESADRKQRELVLLTSLGNALMATRGYAAPEVAETYARANAIREQLGRTDRDPAVLYGLAVTHLVRGQHDPSLRHATELLEWTERHNHPAAIVAHRVVAWPLFAMGHVTKAHEHLEQMQQLVKPDRDPSLAYLYGSDPVSSGRVIAGMVLNLLGNRAAARDAVRDAIELVRAFPHANSQGYVLYMAAVSEMLGGDHEAARAHATAALKLSEEQGLTLWLGWSRVVLGWAAGAGGDVEAGAEEMRRGLADSSALGAGLLHTAYLGLLAELLCGAGRLDEAEAALDEAELLAADHNERVWESELQRVRGEVILARGLPAADAQACFVRAVEIARRHQTPVLEQRAAASLARL
jgi:serine/threonine protein kinase/predicted ATPase